MKQVALTDACGESRQRAFGRFSDMPIINEFYIDVMRMVALIFAPLLVGAVVTAMLLIFFAIIGPPG